jgi:acyl carrier protein
MTNTVNKLRVVIRDAIGAKEDLDIAPDAPLRDVVTSSLQFVVILGEIERVFEVMLPDEELSPERLSDLATIARLLERLGAQPGA